MYLSTAAIALAAVIPTLATPLQKRVSGVKIRSGRSDICLSLAGLSNPGDGSVLVLQNCFSPTLSLWDIDVGPGSIVLSNRKGDDGSVFVADAGLPLANGSRAKVWHSFPGSPQQT